MRFKQANTYTIRCWVAAHMCVLSHFRTCDVRAEVCAERVWNCACGSACVWAIFRLAICDRTFLSDYLKRCIFYPFFCIPTYFSFDHLDLPALCARFTAAARQLSSRSKQVGQSSSTGIYVQYSLICSSSLPSILHYCLKEFMDQ